MLTREEIHAYTFWGCKYSLQDLKNSHIEALDLKEELMAQLAKDVGAVDNLEDEIERLTAERKTHLDIIEQLKAELGFKDLAMNMVIIENALLKKPQGNTTGNLLIPRKETQTGCTFDE